jgi:hypothetical protein
MSNYPDDLNRKGTRHDREFFSYTTCKDKVAKRVKVCQDEGEAIKVELDYEGIEIIDYNESPSVAGLATATIINYTVAVGKTLTLVLSDVSGDNRGKYRVELNGSVIAKRRTYYTDYDNIFKFANIKLVEGDNIKIIVENQSNLTGDFNANLQGSVKDA